MKISSIVTTAKEEWKDIKGYEGYYQISNKGNVRSLDRILNQRFKHGRYEDRRIKGKLLATTDNGNGYLIVNLNKNNKRKNYYVHRLVAEHFIGEIPEGYVINHKDYDKYNNAVDNLEIITQKENIMHSIPNMEGPNRKFKDYKKRYIRYKNNGYEVTVKKVYIGRYQTLQEAINARDLAIESLNYYKEA
jgi:hypothetical protein